MAVKASAAVTLSCYRDIDSVTRYYKLESSTPSKPTSNPPSGWTDAEPSYTSGSTNSLYFCDLTIFSDDTWAYSTVSKSSSYEAAKEAYEKINIIEQTGTGGNLIKNGYGELLDNTNFGTNGVASTFTRGDCPDGCYGYFSYGRTESIPFNPNIVYEYSYYVRLHEGRSGYSYFSVIPYDVDGKLISHAYVMNYNPNLFYLSEDLKDGDTVVHFTDLSKWYTNTSQTYQRSFLIFGYTDSTGYTYPDGTYSRYYCEYVYENDASVDKTNHTITLKAPWSGGTFTAGTCIAQTSAGQSYCYYGQEGTVANTDWVEKKGLIYAGDLAGKIDIYSRRLLYAKSIQVFLWDMGGSIVADYAKIYLGEKVVDKDSIKTVDVEYYLSTSSTSLSGGSWVTTAPAWVDGKYMWSRTKITNGAGTVSYSPSETGTCIAGAKGATGSTGATGTGISSITEEYYLSTSKETPTGGSWTTTPPTWESGKYIWTRSKIVYTNPSSTTYTTALCDSSWEAANEVDAKKVDKDKIIAAINLEGENAKIKAEKITLEGATIADNFTATNLHITGDSTFEGKVTATKLVVKEDIECVSGDIMRTNLATNSFEANGMQYITATLGVTLANANISSGAYIDIGHGHATDNSIQTNTVNIHADDYIGMMADKVHVDSASIELYGPTTLSSTLSVSENATFNSTVTCENWIWSKTSLYANNSIIVYGGSSICGFNINITDQYGVTCDRLTSSGGWVKNIWRSDADGNNYFFGHSISDLPLSGGTMSGNIHFPDGLGIYNSTNGSWLLRMNDATYHSNLASFGSSSCPSSIYTSDRVWWKGSSTTYFSTTSSSDRRLKDEVYADMSPYEDFFMRLSPVAFKYHDGLYNAGDRAPLIQWGYYAQDTIEAFNESGLDWTTHELVVVEDGELSTEELKYVNEDDMLKMNYQNMTALNTYMIQKNRNEIEELKAQVRKLLSAMS